MINSAELFARFKKYHDQEDLVEEVMKIFYSSFLLSAESTAIDCGCHKGFHTEPLSRCCKQVIAVDANKDMCDFMEDMISKHGIKNCKIVHSALQDDKDVQQVTFYVSDNYLGRSSLTRLWDAIDKEVSYRPVVSPATTIDQLVSAYNIDHVDFIKLDLEGGEYKALKGADSLLRRDTPVIVMENSVHAATQGRFADTDTFDFLSAQGYTLVTPNSTPVSRDHPFPFWYLFGIPSNRFEEISGYLLKAYMQICSDRNLV